MTDSVPDPVELRLLGLPHLRLPGGERVLLERHDAALLTLLATEGPMPRLRAATLLWPSAPAGTAQTNLRQRLFRLKQRARAELFGSASLIALADGVRHDLHGLCPGNEIEEPLLGTLDYTDAGELGDWVAAAREHRRVRMLEALAERAGAFESEGRWDEALACAERIVVATPTAEHAHRRVMRLHYLRDDRAAALAAFAHCKAALALHLEADPGAATRELAGLIERSGGLPQPVGRPAVLPSPSASLELLRPPQLVGREREWSVLEQAHLDRRPTLLLGEPGVGKSRLAGDFARRHGRAASVAALAGDRLVPYALLSRTVGALLADEAGAGAEPLPEPVVAELARLLPELGPSAPGNLQPARLRQAFEHAAGAARHRGLRSLVLDDLHFADDASLEMLVGWLAGPSDLYLLMTARAAEMPAVLARWLESESAEPVVTIRVTPLDAPGVAALLASLGGDGSRPLPDAAAGACEPHAGAEALLRRTGGNPLFILETLRLRRSGGPAELSPSRIDTLLDRRLAALADAPKRLARIAALAGPDFSVELAARVLGLHPVDLAEPWASLEQAHVFRQGGFHHDLVAEAALRSVPHAVAEALHSGIAEAAESLDHAPARIAEHWRRAAQPARAAAQFEHAAGTASGASRPVEALRFWDAAAECHTQTGDAAAAFRAGVQAAHAAIASRSAAQVGPRIDALLAAARSDAERLEALLLQAKQLGTNSNFRAAEPVASEALALAERIGRELQVVQAALLLGVARALTGRPAEALALFEAKAPLLARLGDKVAEADFSGAYCHALHTAGRIDDAVRWAERAFEISRHAGDLHDHAIAVGNLAVMIGRTGKHRRALELAERAHALQRELGEPRGTPYVVSELNLGSFCLLTGQLGEAVAAFERGCAACEDTTSRVAYVTQNHLAGAYLRLGQPARARQALAPLVDSADPATRLRRAVVTHRIAAFARSPGTDALVAAFEAHGDAVAPIDRLGVKLAIGAVLPGPEAAAFLRDLCEEAALAQQPTVATTAQVLYADALRRAGSNAEAGRAAAQAVDLAQGNAWHDLDTPLFWWLARQALDVAGLAAAATDAARAGAAWIDEALPHVPDAFRHGFLNRARGVAELRAAVRRP